MIVHYNVFYNFVYIYIICNKKFYNSTPDKRILINKLTELGITYYGSS